jgi:hypothetical protein
MRLHSRHQQEECDGRERTEEEFRELFASAEGVPA